jgi:hypothetical protein
MISPCCLCTPPHQCLKARIVEREETAIARRWLGKHVPVAVNVHTAVEELLEIMFYMWSVSYQILSM